MILNVKQRAIKFTSLIQCATIGVFPKSAQQLNTCNNAVMQYSFTVYIIFTEFTLQASLSSLAWGWRCWLHKLSKIAMFLDDTCIFLLREESHRAVGHCGWLVYIETPARKITFNHTYGLAIKQKLKPLFSDSPFPYTCITIK